MVKRLISAVTVIAIISSMITTSVFARTITVTDTSKEYTNTIAEEELAETVNYDTSIYNGDRGYLLEETFSGGENAVYGWDLDTRGGGLGGNEWSTFQLTDTSDSEAVSMTRHFMPHKGGTITFESCVVPTGIEDGFYYELTGLGKRIFKFITYNGNLCLEDRNGTLTRLTKYNVNERIPVKAYIDFDSQAATISVNGRNVGEFGFAENCTQIDTLCISTSKENEMTVVLEYFFLYFNYIINDTFMHGGEGVTPDEWTLKTDSVYSGIKYDTGMYYPDTYAYVLDDRTTVDGIELTRNFAELTDDFVYEVFFLIKEKRDGITLTLDNENNDIIKIQSKDNNLVLNGSETLVKDFMPNFWYKLQITAYPSRGMADVCINYKTILKGYELGKKCAFNKIGFSTDVKRRNELRIDDVILYKKIELPDDYVKKPEIVRAKDGVSVGMQHYAMWNEGSHYGWDKLNSFADRIPYMGHYNERSSEAADWIIKYEVEHGIDFAVYDWHRPNNSGWKGINNPIKLPTRYQALYQGYFNSEYSDCRDFAILYSAISKANLGGIEDWKDNIAPYLVEYFFKDSRYKKINNRPLFYVYNPQSFIDCLGGFDKACEAVEYLEQLCIDNGMAGVRMMWDGSSGVTEDIVNLPGGYAYAYAQVGANYERELENNLNVENRFKNPIKSIAMGWNRNPWQTDSTSRYFLTPEEIGKLSDTFMNEYKTWESEGIDRDKVLMYTCWDEYGEGHFFNPTRVAGFETLNEIRNAITDEGKKDTEDLPDSLSIARMSSLYQPNRRALMDHQLDFPDSPSFLQTIDEDELFKVYEFDFSDSAAAENWEVFQDAENLHWEDGALKFNSTARDVGIALYGLNIPADNIAYARVTSNTPGGGTGMLFYQTTVDTEMGTGGKRFNLIQSGKDWETNLGKAYNSDKLQGNITGLRWDPVDDPPVGTEFAIKKIELLAYIPSQEYLDSIAEYEKLISVKDYYKVTYMGTAITRVVDPFLRNDNMYISAWQFLRDVGCKVTFSWNDKTLTAERDGCTVVMKDQSDVITVNGVERKIPDICYYGGPEWYNYGNFFVPLRSIIEVLGGSVVYNDSTRTANVSFPVKSDGFDYANSRDLTKPMSFMFDTRADFEGWTTNSHIAAKSLKKGNLRLSINGNDPMMFSSSLNIKAEDYNFVRVRMKNQTAARSAVLLFITTDDKTWGGKKKFYFNISANDKDTKEYIVDLRNSAWEGTITQLRFDPVDAAFDIRGNVYIDSIEFLESLDE